MVPKGSAQAALALDKRLLEPNMPLSVAISNPERKKERTDAGADEREVYVAGLSKHVNREDLEGVFAKVQSQRTSSFFHSLTGSWWDIVRDP